MKVAADTNVLVRAIVADDPVQARLAQAELAHASLVAIATPALCELVWVLDRGYAIARADIADALRRLIASTNVVINRPAVEAGLALLESGGDFADGVIAFEGRWLGGDIFLSFDKQATGLVEAQGGAVRLLG